MMLQFSHDTAKAVGVSKLPNELRSVAAFRMKLSAERAFRNALGGSNALSDGYLDARTTFGNHKRATRKPVA